MKRSSDYKNLKIRTSCTDIPETQWIPKKKKNLVQYSSRFKKTNLLNGFHNANITPDFINIQEKSSIYEKVFNKKKCERNFPKTPIYKKDWKRCFCQSFANNNTFSKDMNIMKASMDSDTQFIDKLALSSNFKNKKKFETQIYKPNRIMQKDS